MKSNKKEEIVDLYLKVGIKNKKGANKNEKQIGFEHNYINIGSGERY